MRCNGDLLIDDDLTVAGDISGNLNADQLLTGTVPAAVVIESDYRLLRLTSSRLYKTAIEPLKDWRWLLNITPVEFDPIEHTGTRKLPGFISEEIAERCPQAYGKGLYVHYNDRNYPDSVAYEKLTAPLVLAVQELHARVTALEATRH